MSGNHGNWRAAAHALYAPGANGVVHDDDTAPGPGVVLYLLPMGAGQGKGGSSRGWGSPTHSFWCCHGTSVESFAKLADSLFFYRCAFPACMHPAWLIRIMLMLIMRSFLRGCAFISNLTEAT